MGWPSRIKKILGVIATGSEIANNLGLPVPNMVKAVDAIHGSSMDNKEADVLNAAAIDSLAARVKALENQVEKLMKAKK